MKTCIITGAARGFGLALTKVFISNQWDVVPLVRKDQDATELKRINNERCFPIIGDVTENKVQAVINESLKVFNGIDLLINNAGIGGKSVSLYKTTPEEVFALINVHCLGVLRVTQAVLPFMKNNGVIINISSRFGSITKISKGELDDVGCSYAYRIAKAAQNMLTQCICREFKNTGLKICSVHPGRLKTETSLADADRTPEEAAVKLFEKIKKVEHGMFYNIFEGTLEW